MIDANGDEWLTVSEAARAVRVRPNTIYVWANRKKIRTHRPRRGELWIHAADLRKCELDWRKRNG